MNCCTSSRTISVSGMGLPPRVRACRPLATSRSGVASGSTAYWEFNRSISVSAVPRAGLAAVAANARRSSSRKDSSAFGKAAPKAGAHGIQHTLVIQPERAQHRTQIRRHREAGGTHEHAQDSLHRIACPTAEGGAAHDELGAEALAARAQLLQRRAHVGGIPWIKPSAVVPSGKA